MINEFINFFSSLKSRLRVVALLEGLSFLILLGIAMPLKYMYGEPEMVRTVGMAHGALFVWYILLIGRAKFDFEWTWGQFFMAGVASLLPAGTFYADYKLFRLSEEKK